MTPKQKALLRSITLSFVRAFLGVFIVGLAGVAASPDFKTGKAALIALVTAAIVAGLRAVQALLEKGGILPNSLPES